MTVVSASQTNKKWHDRVVVPYERFIGSAFTAVGRDHWARRYGNLCATAHTSVIHYSLFTIHCSLFTVHCSLNKTPHHLLLSNYAAPNRQRRKNIWR